MGNKNIMQVSIMSLQFFPIQNVMSSTNTMYSSTTFNNKPSIRLLTPHDIAWLNVSMDEVMVPEMLKPLGYKREEFRIGWHNNNKQMKL